MGLLYTKMKIFHYPRKLASLPAEVAEVQPPLHVRVKPTNVCNHACWYCAYRRENLQLGQDMAVKEAIPRERMLALVEDFIAMGVKAVTFSGGGEPLCYPALDEVVERLSARGIKLACLTNGALLQGRIAECFARYGTWLRISIDGWDGPSYAAYRGVAEGEFDKVLANMAAFKELGGDCLLGVSIIVDHKNAPHVHDLISLLSRQGVDSIKVAPCLTSNDIAEVNAYHQPFLQSVKEQVSRAQAEVAGSGPEIFNSYQEQLGTFKKDYGWCPYAQINPVVGADLNVYTCHDKAYNLKEGRLFSIAEEGGFRQGWQANKARFMQVDPRAHCNHHCMVDEKNRMILEYLGAAPEHLEFV